MISWLFHIFKRDENNLYNGKIVPFSHYKYILYLSYIGIITPLYMFYYNCYFFGILSSLSRLHVLTIGKILFLDGKET